MRWYEKINKFEQLMLFLKKEKLITEAQPGDSSTWEVESEEITVQVLKADLLQHSKFQALK